MMHQVAGVVQNLKKEAAGEAQNLKKELAVLQKECDSLTGSLAECKVASLSLSFPLCISAVEALPLHALLGQQVLRLGNKL